MLRFHPLRDSLLAEAHARPSTSIGPPSLAARVVTLSGEEGAEADRLHMAALCERTGQPAPPPGSRWWLLVGDDWRLRWERHTEVSAWTMFRTGVEPDTAQFSVTGLDTLPSDWIAALPGEVIVAAHAAMVSRHAELPFVPEETVGSKIGLHPIWVYSDFRPGRDSFTRFVVVAEGAGNALIGRTLQQVFEVETYRLLALLAFPLAQRMADTLKKLESEVDQAADRLVNQSGVDADRELLNRLAALAGEAEAMAGRSNFRFAAARAYYGLVSERITGWQEQAVEGLPTIGEFMERRLAPAMRTCASVSDRQRAVIDRIARTVQVLNTRVQVASEALNAQLLASMDKRSQLQLRLQQTVEGLSIVAVSYYALALLKLGFEGLGELTPWLNPTVATALAAPLVVFAVWRLLRRVRAQLGEGNGNGQEGEEP